MGDALITITNAATWIDEIWSPELNTAVEFNIVIAGIIDDKSSMMPHGDVFHYPDVHNLTVATKGAGVANPALREAFTEVDQTFTVGTHQYCAFGVDDIAEVQSKYNIRGTYTKRAAYVLARSMDFAIGALFAASSNQSVGTLGAELTDANMRAAWTFLANSAAPQASRYIVISPATYAGLLNLDKYTARTYVGEESLKAVRQALVGNIYGAEIYISQLLTGTAPSSSGAMFHKDHFFKIVQRSPQVHSEYRALDIGWTVVMDQIYGVFEKQEVNEAGGASGRAVLWNVRLQSIK